MEMRDLEGSQDQEHITDCGEPSTSGLVVQ